MDFNGVQKNRSWNLVKSAVKKSNAENFLCCHNDKVENQ